MYRKFTYYTHGSVYTNSNFFTTMSNDVVRLSVSGMKIKHPQKIGIKNDTNKDENKKK